MTASARSASKVSTIDSKINTATAVRDKSGQVIRQTWLPGGLDFGTVGAPRNIRPATCSIRHPASSPRPATRPTTRAESASGIPPETREIVYANGIRTAFSYSPLRRWLSRVRTTTSGGAVLMDMTYTRDGAGRITAIDGAPSTTHAAGTAGDWTRSR